MARPLTHDLRADRTPLGLREYEAAGGYQALGKALGGMMPEAVLGAVKDSGLRGRGGAGFPTGVKWSVVPRSENAPRPVYLVANADEMEPGTFKDRLLLEGNPHQFLEGVILSAYAIGAEIAYVFLRHEYVAAAARLERAITEARQAGWIGKKIHGAGFGLDVRLHRSAGRYMCGEETALLNALQGNRSVPRSKPPFPQSCGLFGKPTVVQNAETLCNVPHIVLHGPEWFKGLSSGKDAGTKIYGVSGKVRRPGLWELPMGVTIREFLEVHAGGMRDGRQFRGVLPGGASTDFLISEHLDLAMDFDTIQLAGSRLGTGTMIVLDDATCPVGMVRNLIRFFARESCGWCTPCREGLPWAAHILDALEDGRGEMGDLDRLAKLTRQLAPGRTYCALAPGAVEPLQSALKYFREDFERHVRDKKCPWR